MQMEKAQALLRASVDERRIPGYAVLVGQGNDLLLRESYGCAQWIPQERPMTLETMFDLASLTKLTAVWPLIIRLLDAGKLTLDTTLPEAMDFPPERYPHLARTTIFQLLTHTAGLVEFMDTTGETRQERLESLYRAPLKYAPDQQVLYSDLSFIFLGEIAAHQLGMPLEMAVNTVFGPLGMHDTMFNPPKEKYAFAATEIRPGQSLPVCGTVHDERAEQLGGVAGHAGLFSTVDDMGRFARAILLGHEDLPEKWVARSCENQTARLNSNRALGWIVYRAQEGGNIVGHTGFTGTSLWMNAKDQRYCVLLTNRVHPTRANNALGQIREELFQIVFDA